MDRARGAKFLCGTSHRMPRGPLALACAAVALFVPGSASAQTIPDVAALQVALRAHGTYVGAIDGIFGPRTSRAVRTFQRRRGLVVDGLAGRRTLVALGSYARHRLGSRVVRSRASGWDVAALQYLLARCGLSPGAIDGRFGPRTRSAVVRYEHRAGLLADGAAGPATIAALRRSVGCGGEKGMVPPGETVSGVRIGGLTARRAEIALRSAFARPLRLEVRGRIWLAEPGAFAHPAISRAVHRALHSRPGAALRLAVTVQPWRVRAFVTKLDRDLCRRPVNARLEGLRSLRPHISRGEVGCQIRHSQTVRAIVARLKGLDRSVIQVPIERTLPAVTRANFGSIVVVRRDSHRLYLYRGTRLLRVFRIATGRRRNPTPLGRFSIVSKVRNPWWFPPESEWAHGRDPIPPGPGNPLGTRWMGISAPGVGVHGTPDSVSVGYSRSHGCIRMYPPEAAWLFRRVRVGAPVIVVPA